jgi:hypothetical protein
VEERRAAGTVTCTLTPQAHGAHFVREFIYRTPSLWFALLDRIARRARESAVQLCQGTRKLTLLRFRLFPLEDNELMKKAVLAVLAAGMAFFSVAPAFADSHHHHPVCHKVRVHHHWERHCK